MTLRGRAILFDIDGTLVDSTPVVERSWRTWSHEYGIDAEQVLAVCHGRRSQDTVEEFIADGIVTRKCLHWNARRPRGRRARRGDDKAHHRGQGGPLK